MYAAHLANAETFADLKCGFTQTVKAADAHMK